jgi:uncharacterized protein YbjT (DUF2867 family)
MSEKRMVVTGATGMVGGLALKYALSDPAVGAVTAIGRRATDIVHPKLRQVEHEDFTDLQPVEGELEGQDVALFCLGVYTGAVPDSEFRMITVDYTAAFAEALLRQSPGAAFCLLSGAGADQAEKSRISFARYKGMAENALLALGYPRVHIFRPGYIYPVSPRKEPNLTYRLSRRLYPLLQRIYPNVGIPSDELAHVMVRAGLNGTPGHSSPILENRDIRRLAAGMGGSVGP